METITKIVKQDDKINFFDKINDYCCINLCDAVEKVWWRLFELDVYS